MTISRQQNLMFTYLILLLHSCHLADFSPNQCPRGMSGDTCRSRCHCRDKAECDLQNGPCADCEDGWYGHHCQYVNMAQDTSDFRSSVLYSDAHNHHVSSFIYKWAAPFPFTWIRLRFPSPQVLSPNFKTSVLFRNEQRGENEDEWFPCRRQVIHVVSCAYVDIHCDYVFTVQEMNITMEGLDITPDVFISGGQQVGDQAISYYTARNMSVGADKDMNKLFSVPDVHILTCSYTFNTPVVIRRYIMPHQASSKLVKISYSYGDVTTEMLIDTTTMFINEPLAEPIMHVDISYMSEGNTTRCNAELFGDFVCPVGTFGLKCMNACNCSISGCYMETGECKTKNSTQNEMCPTACLRGYYGPSCSTPCPLHCAHGHCDSLTGNCEGCQPQYTGDKCEYNCPSTYFGFQCAHQCSDTCLNGQCHAQTGRCNFCPDGKTGFLCEHNCSSNTFGPSCSENCPDQCQYDCDAVTGHCHSCPQGYVGAFCNQTCSKGFFGHHCQEHCPINCLDNDCDHESGVCYLCKPGYTGDMCNKACKNNTYGTNCFHKCSVNCINCSATTGTCAKCNPGYQGTKCLTQCYTPYYGDGCSTMCSSNCSYRTCNAINGKCFMCPTGKSGDFCENSCKQGYHGIGCQQLCSNKCLNKNCHPALGICLKCPSGYEGDSCSNVCNKGTYGPSCGFLCSPNCQDNDCGSKTGHCKRCLPGYSGIFCENACKPTYFGLECNQNCSTLCLNNLCNHVTGRCMQCLPGFLGNNCDKACPKNTYGQDCAKRCNSKCKREVHQSSESICHPITGDCISATQSKDDENETGVWIGVSCTIVISCFVVAIAVIVYKWNKADWSCLKWSCQKEEETDML